MNELSKIFRYGIGVKKDPQRALRFSTASTQRSDFYGYNNLAIHYLDGIGVKKDYQKALGWFIKAYKGGHPEAANNIGRMYENGWGVPKNADIAAGWYERSAKRGSAWAANNRAWLALNGPAQLKDSVLAAKYYALSAAFDREEPSDAAKAILGKLGETDKRKAVQIVLDELGYKTTRKDGRYDRATKQAIKRFKREHRDAETGNSTNLLTSLSKAWWLKNKPRFDLF
jgi:TPR repeat protein